jgi:hypothetical protein
MSAEITAQYKGELGSREANCLEIMLRKYFPHPSPTHNFTLNNKYTYII